MSTPPPEREPSLAATGTFHSPTRLDGICDDFVRAWRAGGRPRIEEHLSAVPPTARGELLLELVREELALRRQAGEDVSLDEYLSRFPADQETVARAFDTTNNDATDNGATDGGSRARSTVVPSRSRAEHPRPSSGTGARFQVLRPHAQGGLGAVFVALDGELNREVALKEILDRHADDASLRRRFVFEAEITGGLEHPGIVPVYGLGSYRDGRPYYAMRFIRGDSLKDAIAAFHAGSKSESGAGSGVAFRQLLRRFLDVCNAIEYAHARGVLHRDIKPGNIIVGQYGETLVIDWGLAKTLGASAPQPGKTALDQRQLPPLSSDGMAQTLPGSTLGTPGYMSPEQARGDLDSLGPRSDLYSLGATLYSVLTGKMPFQGTVDDVLRAVQAGRFPPPRAVKPGLDPALEAICLKAMALEPSGRSARWGSSQGQRRATGSRSTSP